MTADHTNAILTRALSELEKAILCRRALIGLEESNSVHHVDFISLASDALFNQMIAHSILALNQGKHDRNFWTLYEQYRQLLDARLTTTGAEITKVESVSKALAIIRGNTHFHVGQSFVGNPAGAWHKAGLTGSALGHSPEIAFDLMSHLSAQVYSKRRILNDYDGSDARAIAEHADRHNLLWRPTTPDDLGILDD